MADYWVLIHTRGPAWDPSTPRREQTGWKEHADFMDALAEEGFVVLGGPIGHDIEQDTMLLLEAESEEDIRARFEDDPWEHGVLEIKSIEPWTIWLRANEGG